MTAASADLTALALDLAKAGTDMGQAVHDVLAETAAQVQVLAASMAPRKTGALARSITTTWVGTNIAVISPGVPYGPYQEFGTGSRGEFPGHAYEIKPKNANGRLAFRVGGKTVYAKKVMHPGVAAKPFMRPALIQALGPMANDLAKAGALKITKGSK